MIKASCLRLHYACFFKNIIVNHYLKHLYIIYIHFFHYIVLRTETEIMHEMKNEIAKRISIKFTIFSLNIFLISLLLFLANKMIHTDKVEKSRFALIRFNIFQSRKLMQNHFHPVINLARIAHSKAKQKKLTF